MQNDINESKFPIWILTIGLMALLLVSYNVFAQDGREADDPEMVVDTVKSKGNTSTTVTTELEDGTILTSSTNAKNATILELLAPTQMVAGNKYKIVVSVRNAGTVIWNDPSLDQLTGQYELSAVPVNRTAPTWGINSVALNDVVAPEGKHTFEFVVTAPQNPGTYELKWQMASGGQYFGESSPSIAVNVIDGKSDGVKGEYNLDNVSTYISQDVSSSMNANGTYGVTVVMRNDGKTTWEPGFFWLQYSDPKNNMVLNELWGTGKVGLTTKVEPGSNAVFKFDVKAPSEGGSYLWNWMMASSAGTFGPSTPNLMIPVAGPPPGSK